MRRDPIQALEATHKRAGVGRCVGIGDGRQEAARRTAEEIAQKFGVEVFAFRLDFADEGSSASGRSVAVGGTCIGLEFAAGAHTLGLGRHRS